MPCYIADFEDFTEAGSRCDIACYCNRVRILAIRSGIHAI